MLLAFLGVWSGLCFVALVVSMGMPIASLTLFLLQVCMCPIALNHFLWVTVFCIYPELVSTVEKPQCL